EMEGGRLGWQEGGLGRLGQRGVSRRIAVESLKFDGGQLVFVFDAGGGVGGTKGPAGIVALFLHDRNLAVEAAKDIDHFGESAEVGFDIGSAGGFLQEDLGDSHSGGLETDFGQLGGVLAAEIIDQVILIEPV